MDKTNGWETYSKLVLQQLETMAGGIEGLRTELQDVKNQLTELKAKEDRVQDLKAWKEKFDEVRLKIDPLKIFTDEEVFSYMTPQQLAFIKDAKDLTNEELWQRVKQKNNLIKEINKEMKDLRDEVDKRKSKGVWSIPTKAVEDMTDEELFE